MTEFVQKCKGEGGKEGNEEGRREGETNFKYEKVKLSLFEYAMPFSK